VAASTHYAKSRAGRVAFAVVDEHGRVRGFHIHERHRSASLVKAMLLVAYLNRGSVRNRSLGFRDAALLHPMITRSDNGAASRVYRIVGPAGVRKLANRAGMKNLVTSSNWSRTQLSPYDQSRFFYAIDSYIPKRHRAYALSQLAGITPSQRWGLGRDVPRGWRIFFKGGWLPRGRAWIVNQSALFEHGKTRVGLSVMTDRGGGFGYGQQTLRGVGARLLSRIGSFL
jgi:hypothetical protein